MRCQMTELVPADMRRKQVEHQGCTLLVTKLLRFDYWIPTSQIPIRRRFWDTRVPEYFFTMDCWTRSRKLVRMMKSSILDPGIRRCPDMDVT